MHIFWQLYIPVILHSMMHTMWLCWKFQIQGLLRFEMFHFSAVSSSWFKFSHAEIWWPTGCSVPHVHHHSCRWVSGVWCFSCVWWEDWRWGNLSCNANIAGKEHNCFLVIFYELLMLLLFLYFATLLFQMIPNQVESPKGLLRESIWRSIPFHVGGGGLFY